MSVTANEELQQAIDGAMQQGRVPGIALAWVRNGSQPTYVIQGTDAAATPLDRSSLLPVASVTKLATALAVLRLVDTAEIDLDDELSAHIPDAAAAQPGVTLRRLLSHTAGLPIDLPRSMVPYAPGLDWPTLATACRATPLETQPGQRVQYGNVGYGLLALLVERYTHQDFPQALQTTVLEPLGIEAYLGTEPPRAIAQLADIRGKHRDTELEPYNSRFWRSLGLPWAGLITTVDGALQLITSFHDSAATILKPTTLKAATSNQTGDLGGGSIPPLVWPFSPWGLGPEIRDAKTPHWAPDTASPGSFGHAGQSGCLVWCDPTARLTWAMLGTRTADGGWLLRHGRAIGAALFAAST